jgi:hypothetical protein
LEEPIRRRYDKPGHRQSRYQREVSPLDAQILDWLKVFRGPLPYGLLAVAVLLWLVSLPAVDLREMTDIGLLAVLPVAYYLALLMITVSFCLLAYRNPERTRLLLLHLVTLIAMFHATPAMLYRTLRYSWAWKHAGIVDYIQRYGSVDTTIPALNAYHNWPGFFAFNALLTDAAGLENAVQYAAWGSLFFNLLFLGALLLVFRSLSSDLRLVWMATWFFFLANWVGQDYFSPQSFVYLLYLFILGIILTGFRAYWPPAEDHIRRWLRHPRISRFFHGMLVNSSSGAATMASPAAGPALAVEPPQPVQRLMFMALTILFMAVISFSHQLTPLMAVSALVLLTLFQVIYTRGLMVMMGVLAIGWIWLYASPFMGANLRSVLASVGAVEGNVSGNLINLELASTGQVVVALMGRGLTVLVMLLAGIGFFRRLRNGKLDLAAALLMASPFLMLFGNAYGGEILFRIYFFAVPFMAFFIAGLFYPRHDLGRNWATPAAAAVLSVVMVVGFLFAYYGKEKQYYFSPGEVAAAEYLFNNAPPGSLIVEGTRNYPSLFRNYEHYIYVAIDREPERSREEFVQDPVPMMVRWMANPEYPAAYLIVTRSMKAEIDMVGTLPAGSLGWLETALIESDQFEVLYNDRDAKIFVLRER